MKIILKKLNAKSNEIDDLKFGLEMNLKEYLTNSEIAKQTDIDQKQKLSENKKQIKKLEENADYI